MTDDESNAAQRNPYRSPESAGAMRSMVPGLAAILVSFVTISALGSAFIFSYWRTIDVSIGIARSVGFVAIMGGVHFVGFRIWRRQQDSVAKGPAAAGTNVWQRNVPHGLLWIVLATVLSVLLTSLML